MLFLNAGWAIYRNTPPHPPNNSLLCYKPPERICHHKAPCSEQSCGQMEGLFRASSYVLHNCDIFHPGARRLPSNAPFWLLGKWDLIGWGWMRFIDGKQKKKQMGRRESCTPTKKTAFLFFYQFLAFSNPLAIGCFYQKYRFLTKKQRIRASCEKKKRCQVKPRLWHKYISFLLKL